MPGHDRGGHGPYDAHQGQAGKEPYRGPSGPGGDGRPGAPARGARSPERSGGVPDGLLVGGLAFLLGVAVLVWSATGLAGLLAHGSWPDQVTFSRTPVAMGHLVRHPDDLPGAWTHTPEAQLSGYGLMWGLFIAQVMVLATLAVFVIGTVARWRARRAAEAAGARRTAQDPARPGASQALGAHAGQAAAVPPDGPGRPADPAVPLSKQPAAEPSTPRDQLRPEFAQPATPPRDPAAPPVFPPAADTPRSGTAPAPDLASAPASDPARPGAAPADPWPVPVSVPPPVVLGPPEARQTAAVRAVTEAEGPALVLTSAPVVWEETRNARAKLGPVLLYDPTHRCDTPARLHWSPLAGCADRDVAAERARALLAPVRPTARIDSAVADSAETLLRCFLHAAAVDGRQFRHVHRWAQGRQVQDAVRTLRTHPKAASGTAGELEAALTAHPERRDIAQELIARALSALSSVHIRDSCTPNRADTAALDSFLTEQGTLYLVGEAVEDPKSHPGAVPLLTALAASVVAQGRRRAARSSAGRLDPPLTLVLEDVAAVAPLPDLPDLLRTGPDQGMPTTVLLRSREQARTRWPDAELPL